MRFLCLHGSGTNNQIFEAQTAALRYELGDGHTFEFVEGIVPSPLGTEFKGHFVTKEPCFAYYDENDASSLEKVLDQLETYIAVEGPFDAIIGFSQGATLATTYLVNEKRRSVVDSIDPSRKSYVKCAVLIAGRLSAGLQIRLRDTSEAATNVPCTIIWGKEDQACTSDCEQLVGLCENENRSVFVHDGGHEVPSTGRNLTLMVNAIRRTIDRALLMQ